MWFVQRNTHAVTLGVVHEKNRHAMTPVDPCVVYGSNKHAITLAVVHEKNTCNDTVCGS